MVDLQLILPSQLARYAEVPIAFQVRSILRVVPVGTGLGGLQLVEQPVPVPYLKDYDIDEKPTDWPKAFDVRNWAFFLAMVNGHTAGAAAVAFNTPGVHMLEGRGDLSVLWDIRVHPHFRGGGVGRALFEAAEHWSRARNCRQMKIETQNINVPACRFYSRMGAVLGAIHCYAYSSTPYANEAMLLWYKDLYRVEP